LTGSRLVTKSTGGACHLHGGLCWSVVLAWSGWSGGARKPGCGCASGDGGCASASVSGGACHDSCRGPSLCRGCCRRPRGRIPRRRRFVRCQVRPSGSKSAWLSGNDAGDAWFACGCVFGGGSRCRWTASDAECARVASEIGNGVSGIEEGNAFGVSSGSEIGCVNGCASSCRAGRRWFCPCVGSERSAWGRLIARPLVATVVSLVEPARAQRRGGEWYP
jgi:hypothetical protein